MACTRSPLLAPLPLLALLAAVALSGAAGCENTQGAPLPPNMPDAPCKCASDNSCNVTYQHPQICPDLSPVEFCSRFVGKSADQGLLLYNRGLEGLQITSVSLLGDDNCSFVKPVLSFTPGQSTIAFQRFEAVNLIYAPHKVGPDYAVLQIQSNAENFPVLNIAVCGQGYTGTLKEDGGCLACMKPADSKPACGMVPDGGP